MAPPKKPRRTAERILEVTLELFNRFGEPNVSTTLISAELNISPGNLYYHYPAKDELINSLFGRYEKALNELLQAADGVENVEDAWVSHIPAPPPPPVPVPPIYTAVNPLAPFAVVILRRFSRHCKSDLSTVCGWRFWGTG